MNVRMMKWAVVAAISSLLGGCASLPPILERWADLEIATQSFYREGSNPREFLSFYEDGRAEVNSASSETPKVRWRVRGAWLEIDTKNDGTYKMRLHALTWTKDRVVAEDPTGKRSVWKRSPVVVSIGPLPQRPGLWMP